MNASKGHILIANPQQNQHPGDLQYLVHDILGDLMTQKFPEPKIYGSPPQNSKILKNCGFAREFVSESKRDLNEFHQLDYT